ncbi:hypothetical protein PM082_016951 [Marasmius tenuissimus]|nr:hypothetical protein PM082_016951 [Marasmius tenuissimus]
MREKRTEGEIPCGHNQNCEAGITLNDSSDGRRSNTRAGRRPQTDNERPFSESEGEKEGKEKEGKYKGGGCSGRYQWNDGREWCGRCNTDGEVDMTVVEVDLRKPKTERVRDGSWE